MIIKKYKWRLIHIKNAKKLNKKEISYDITYNFKMFELKNYDEKKKIFNQKLLNIIMKLEANDLILNNTEK